MWARSTSTRWTKAKAIACVKPMGSTTPDWWRSKPNSTLPIFSAAITISLPGSVFDVRLLRACRERQDRRAAEQRDERASFHSITSSALMEIEALFVAAGDNVISPLPVALVEGRRWARWYPPGTPDSLAARKVKVLH